MIHELRTYTALPRKRSAIVEELEKLMPAFKRHGIRVVGVWTTLIGRSEHVRYMLEYESLADREKKWSNLVQDPDLLRLMQEYGPLTEYQDSVILQPTAFSPLK